MVDTSPEQLLRHAELISRMTQSQRLDALRAVDRGVRRLVMARLRNQFPDATERELIIRHVTQVHGAATARRVYGEVPDDL